ncbi:DUF2782 domain-containing protein [Laribacter hongkongensis]|uniref:DUF2782 domain-containing protein n=1 Tax=Laribacter hongkongensis TaxID=168471 RepID=UPI001EFCA845|nr:DUF2782 domain-containing protein [Laribacter hongkongensis]MCG9053395.1 DUF2782 domain-containing protein [Laribacter hongkongensis]MCG9089971.1 DUF2782 domain-containing protein [Laribacter hongkongensis]
MRPSLLALSLAALVALPAMAAQPALAADPAGLPPPPVNLIDDGSTVEPDVTIRKDGDNRIEEYRVHGKLYAVKVTPPVGPAYYLYDPDGSGTLQPYDLHGGGKLVIPRWVLFSF